MHPELSPRHVAAHTQDLKALATPTPGLLSRLLSTRSR